MKKYNIVILIILLSATYACKDFLDENPKTFLSPSNFYKTEKDLQMGLNVVYTSGQDRYSNMWAAPNWFSWGTDCGELTSANPWPQHNQPSYLKTNFNPSSDMPWWFWDYVYRHVKDANSLLEALPKVNMDATKKTQIEAQVRAWRAHLYFDGVRIFNGIPLILKTTSDPKELNSLKRNTTEEVYAAIIEDLKFAKDNLPNTWDGTENEGRLTSGSAAALLARVYITMAGYPLQKTDMWNEAKTILKEFIDDKKYGSQYGLFSEYADAFKNENIPGKESVWTINFTRSTYWQGSDIHTNFAPLELYYDSRCGLTRGGGWGNEYPTDAFYNSYDKVNDKRFAFTFWTSTADIPDEYADINSSPTGPVVFATPLVKKFREPMPNDNSQGTGIDHYVIRYADVLLMYAEVLNELGDNRCYNFINQVRNRAGLNNLPTLSKDAFKEHLYLEYAWEVCYEGERRFQLTRWGKYYERVKAWNSEAGPNVISGKHELWPVPQREIDINKNLEQNPGY